MLRGRLGRVVAATGVVSLLWGLTSTPAAADAIRDSQWPLQRYGVTESVWQKSQGEGVTVAVIDTGVDAQHQDLTGQVLPGKDFTGEGGDGRVDVLGHGTGMASLIAGHGHGTGAGIMGLAPKAKILPVRIGLEDDESSVPELLPSVDGNQLADAIRFSVDQGAEVINMSLGGITSGAEDKEAIRYAVDNDVVVVASAGNESWPNVGYPARFPGVVAVGAVDVDGGIWHLSNYGPDLTISAPGEQIMRAEIGQRYVEASGTSPAAAYVSAAAALVRAKFPDLSAGQVINRLMKSAMAPPDGTKVPSEKYGAGILNPNQALSKDIPLGPKENPLLARASADDKESSAPPTADPGKDADKAATAAEKPADDDGLPIVLIVAGIGALIVAITAVAIVMTRRRPTY